MVSTVFQSPTSTLARRAISGTGAVSCGWAGPGREKTADPQSSQRMNAHVSLNFQLFILLPIAAHFASLDKAVI
jgi:hypothetical protein